jgi:hypothetical protein
MKIRFLAAAVLALPLAAPASPTGMPSRSLHVTNAPAPVGLRAPWLAPDVTVVLQRPAEKSAVPPVNAGGRLPVGEVRPLAKAAEVTRWNAVPGGFVAELSATSEGALGLRVRLDLGTMPGAMQLRAMGTDGRVETMTVDPTFGNVAWTPWTEGATQAIELFTPVRPGNDGAIAIGAVVHFTQSPWEAKASGGAGVCTLESACAPDDTSLAPGVADGIGAVTKAVVLLSFMDGGGAFLCTGTLINTEKFPAAYLLTANHCIDNAASAASISTLWFSESAGNCQDQLPNLPAAPVQVLGGTQLVFTNYNVDSSLLLMNASPPSDAVYVGWNPARIANGASIVSVSHPKGDTSRYAIGSTVGLFRIDGYPQDEYGVRFSSGIIQGGSSGSGLFTLSGGQLELRGILTGTTVNQPDGMSCTDLNEDALYSRFEIFEPEIDPYIRSASQAPDDAPNRAQDLFAAKTDPATILDQRTSTFALDNRRIDYGGDLDVYRFALSAPAWVSAWSEGANLDTVGSILDSRGVSQEASDDAQASDNHFGVTRSLGPGTYYVQVGHWDAAGTGAYNLRMRADKVDTNYTALWWNAAESGWGLNINHQGNVVFATLFTYDPSGAPMWLVMSDGERQADGSYQGSLYRTTGPAFNAVPFSGAQVTTVGTMRIAFVDAGSGTLTYSYNGTTVTKAITRQLFSTQPTCTWSAFDRSFASNYQDLWWNPAESGWGVNITHQGNILFATLFTYAANGQGMWLVMSDGELGSGGAYSGALYRTSGPAFNASPWAPASVVQVGTMSFSFIDGNSATMTYSVDGVQVTKQIKRQVFGPIKTQCES